MDSASFLFILFGLATAVISNFSRSPVWRSVVLFAASLGVLALLAKSPLALLPLAGFLGLGYLALVLLQRGATRALAVCVIAVVIVYMWLKKYTILPESLFLHSTYFTLGLSYIFFRVLHLLIETGQSEEKRPVHIGAYLLYCLNFTTLISGPIQRYDDFAQDQFASQPVPLGPRVIGLQLERIVRGFFKVNVLAMLLHAFQEDALVQLAQPYPLSFKLWAAFRIVTLYPFFLYCNFSGYIDIVIALARLMRVRLPENFNRPFSAASAIDFWNRWHITLSTWLKNYVYNPLLIVLMRRIQSLTLEPFLGVFCFFVTFFLVGVWHGRTSEFVFFGIVQGGGVAVNKLWQLGMTRLLGRKPYKALTRNPAYIAIARGLTFTWFSFTLFWFWGDWQKIHAVFSAINLLNWSVVVFAVWLCAAVLLTAWEIIRSALLSIKTSEGPVFTHRYALVVYASALGLAAFVITVLLNQPAPGIVYKAF